MKLAARFSFALALLSFSAIGSLACGGSSPPPAAPSQTTGSEEKAVGGDGHAVGGADKDKHHGDISPALKDFHSVLGPVWHSDAGSVRVEKACSNAKAMQDKATGTGDAELVAAAGALDAACAASGRPDVEAKLTTIHERFHALAEKKP